MRLTRRPVGCDSEPVYINGGFGADALLEGMSPSMRAAVMVADAQFEAKGRRLEAERAQLRQERREAGIGQSIRAAQARGELVDMPKALRDGGVGRTPQEVVEYVSAQMDVEDARLAAQTRQAFNQWQSQFYIDTSAPTESDRVELEAGAARAEARREARGRVKAEARAARRQRAETARLIRADRRLIAEGLGGIRPEDV
jgi:hypothetical protein